jgi:hypothetical protein
MTNMPGCKVQKAYGNCLQCEDDYTLSNGDCKAKITKLTWNSIDMDFWDDSDSCKKEESKAVFTIGATSKLNLLPAVSKGKAEYFYSSSSLNGAQFNLEATGSNGWSPNGSCTGQFIGVKTSTLETYYAIDIKQLTGSSLKSFTIEYSMDGVNFIKVQDFSFDTVVANAILTFYFKPVYASHIRLVVKEGTPNIRVEFYYSSAVSMGSQVQ